MERQNGRHQVPFERRFNFLGYIFNPTGKSDESFDERMHKDHHAWFRVARFFRSKDVPWRRKMQRNGGSSLQRILLWMRKLVMESAGLEWNNRMGKYMMRIFFPVRRKENEA